MSNEEKEAIEILKLYFFDNPTLNITKYVNIVLNLIEKQSKEIEEQEDFIKKLQATKDRLDKYDKENTLIIEKQQKEIEKLKEDNKRLRKCHLQYEEMTGVDLLLPSKEEIKNGKKY